MGQFWIAFVHQRNTFQMLIKLNPELLPRISVDFEIAAIFVIKEATLQVNKILKYKYIDVFITWQKFQEKMHDIGIISNYNKDNNFSVMVKVTISLTFVLLEDLNVATYLLANELSDENYSVILMIRVILYW